MDFRERAQKILSENYSLLKDYEELFKDSDLNFIVKENEKLRKELKVNENTLKELRDSNNKIKDENQNLKMALKEQLIDERFSMLKISKNT